MTKIISGKAREIIDSRGCPTVEVDIFLKNGGWGRASVPSGASTGIYEAVELRDGDKKRYSGLGVKKAVDNVNKKIVKKIIGLYSQDQKGIDNLLNELDGTENKSKLGANAILAVSLAVAKAQANSQKIPLYKYLSQLSTPCAQSIMPVPLMNILNGGKHANNNIDLQEFMIAPVGAKNFSEALRWGCEIYHTLKRHLKEKGLSTSVGDEGGFAPNLKNSEQAIEVIIKSCEVAGYRAGKDIYLALDPASSSFFENECYNFEGKKLKSEKMIDYWEKLTLKYPIISIEDGLAEDDWEGWCELTKRLGNKIQIVGDDLFVTNVERLKIGIGKKCANSILIKVNQIGTLTETLRTINLARENNFTYIISHRSGETEDTTISDLAVATASGQIKTGAPARVDRTCKYNQLLRIEEENKGKIKYGGTLIC